MRLRNVLLFLACAVSIACSSNSEKLTKEIDEANSWIASARMVAEFHADRATPKPYTKDALENFSKQLQSSVSRVQSISDPRTPDATKTMQEAQQTISQMSSSIDRADNLSLAQFDLQLAAQQAALTQLADPKQSQAPPK
jgi:phosphatidate phosphatase PAH1